MIDVKMIGCHFIPVLVYRASWYPYADIMVCLPHSVVRILGTLIALFPSYAFPGTNAELNCIFYYVKASSGRHHGRIDILTGQDP
jgi:hypothetical protein